MTIWSWWGYATDLLSYVIFRRVGQIFDTCIFSYIYCYHYQICGRCHKAYNNAQSL